MKLNTLLSSLLLLGGVKSQESEQIDGRKLAEDQIAWLRDEGGFFSPKVHVRPLFDSESAPLGLFANEAFSKGDTIMIVPRKCLLTAGPNSTEDDMCNTSVNLLKEYRLKEKSYYAPYVKYVFSKKDVPLPSSWSQAGKDLILNVRGENLPPKDLTQITFEKDCDGTGDELEEFAYRTVVSRGWSDKLVPVFDMINHQIGRYWNVDSNRVHGKGDNITVHAIRDIAAGEQLFLSYSDCIDERGYENEYVLPQMLRDFGFVVDYPQRWTFPVGAKKNVVFDIDFVNEEAAAMYKEGSLLSPEMKLTWRTKEPTLDQKQILEKELFRVLDLQMYVTNKLNDLNSELERMVIRDYFHSLTLALRYATGFYNKQNSCSSSDENGGASGFVEMDADDESKPKATNDTDKKSKKKSKRRKVSTGEGNTPKDWMACNDFDAALRYESYYDMRSHYQLIEVKHGEKEDDACLYLDGWLHTCASYRPHFHEVLVHYAARYIDQVKRVIFIGGGDSMVLHEVLKYPSLELVVGLELDHEINTATFATFGSQPHYDNDKVQWYYGDAAKSMSVLPKDYYGSFDLVLMDITTKVAQTLKVNDDLTLMNAATLLMKPDGIIVRNEDEGYVPGSKSSGTRYSLDIAYHDVPLYCLQVVAMGSETVDFLTATPKDHGVETLYMDDIDSFQSQFDSWYNYGTEESGIQLLCEKNDRSKNEYASTASGVLMILEAEDVTLALDSSATLESAITQALNNASFIQPVVHTSPLLNNETEGFHIGMYFQENHVIARYIPQINYCAFDVQLYGNDIEKLEIVKTELLLAVKSKQSSSYRFVTDGTAIASEKKTERVGPPRIKDLCSDESNRSQEEGSPVTKIRKKKVADEFGEPKFSTLHSYDTARALEQWKSQKPIAIQSLFQFDGSDATHVQMNNTELSEFVNGTVAYLCEYVQKKMKVENTTDCLVEKVGERTFTTSWVTGNLIGRFCEKSSRIDFNLFILSTNVTGDQVFDAVDDIWDEEITDWKHSQFDVFARGIGNVVNFRGTVEDHENPIWA